MLTLRRRARASESDYECPHTPPHNLHYCHACIVIIITMARRAADHGRQLPMVARIAGLADTAAAAP